MADAHLTVPAAVEQMARDVLAAGPYGYGRYGACAATLRALSSKLRRVVRVYYTVRWELRGGSSYPSVYAGAWFCGTPTPGARHKFTRREALSKLRALHVYAGTGPLHLVRVLVLRKEARS